MEKGTGIDFQILEWPGGVLNLRTSTPKTDTFTIWVKELQRLD